MGAPQFGGDYLVADAPDANVVRPLGLTSTVPK